MVKRMAKKTHYFAGFKTRGLKTREADYWRKMHSNIIKILLVIDMNMQITVYKEVVFMFH